MRTKEPAAPMQGFLPPEGCRRLISTAIADREGAAHREAALALMQHRVQASYLMENFLKYRRPLAYRGPPRCQ